MKIEKLLVNLLVVISLTAFVGCKSDCKKCETTETETTITNIENQLEHVTTPAEALKRLEEGNKRYVADSCLFPHHNHKRIESTAPHQAPFAAVVGCSDSRVPVEVIFDQGVGDIFVIRTAGNSVNDDVVMGSVDYAIEHLGVKVVIVLGHESCGGVTGAISTDHHESEGKIDELLDIIRKDVMDYVGKPDSLDVAIRTNAKKQVERILANEETKQLVEEGKIVVKEAYYNVHTGKVDF